MGAYGSKKTAGDRFRNHVKNILQKYHQMSLLCSERRVAQSDLFVVFRVSGPGWSPGHPRTGSKAHKHIKMEAPRWILGWFVASISYSETFRGCFAHFMNPILIITDVKFIAMLV